MFNLKMTLKLLVVLSLSLILTGCGSVSSSDSRQKSASYTTNLQQNDLTELVKELDLKSQLLQQYEDWKGVPYRLGGESKSGIDCSALVQVIFSDQFDIQLPRSTQFQRKIGQPVAKDELRVGDLVLFKIPGPTGRHIGIYVGDNSFMHASTSQGVMISSLDNSYWKKHYTTARRILDDQNS